LEHLNKNINLIFLIGQSGSGKSLCGNLLSKKIEWEYYDTDTILISKHNKSIEEIFRERGEAFFRSEELSLIEDVIIKNQVVVSTGGGLPEIEGVMPKIKKYGLVFWLKASPEILLKRIEKSNRSHRPLLFKQQSTLSDNLERQLKSRYHLYEQSHYHINTDNRPVKSIVEEIALFVRNHAS
tara:strand:+ start:586 stop:1131 length:546 start_codon:yes stop_codon:yes gene_type:complete